jgi:hypothetical protein
MNLSALRVWYTRLFVLLFLGASYFLLVRSSDGGIFGFDSTFWGQRKLIAQFVDLRLSLGDRVFPNVLVGEDGWMVFTAERSMDNYQNTIEFTDEKIVSIQSKLLRLHSRLSERGIALLLVIVPDKPTLYPEIIPPQIERQAGETRLNRLLSYIDENGPAIVVDLRTMRQDASLRYEVYSKTDSHWNDYGMFLAYEAIMKKIGESYSVEPYTIDDFDFSYAKPGVLDLANNIGSVSLLESPVVATPKFQYPASFRMLDVNNRRILMSWVDDDRLPRLLMYHDSFGFPLARWLSMNFRETISIPHYSGGTIWTLNWIEQTAPDIVIIEIAERYLHDLDTFLGD